MRLTELIHPVRLVQDMVKQAKPEEPFPEPVWHPDWNEDTAALAHEASLDTRDRLSGWADSLTRSC
jgi:hypothetical protein